MICPYCGKPARWCENKEIYGRNFGRSYMCYWCKDCDAFVGCHQNTHKPLGTMANKELRQMRMKAHAVFDPLWRSGKISRRMAYKNLALLLGKKEIHIGEATIADCEDIIEAIRVNEKAFEK